MTSPSPAVREMANNFTEHHRFQIIGGAADRKQDMTEAATWTDPLEPKAGTVPCLVYDIDGKFCAVIAGMDDLLDNDTCAAEIARLAKVNEALVEALRPFARFVEQYDRQPMANLGDEFYGIHTGTEFEAAISFTDCRKALAALNLALAKNGREG